jgi:hypothetical protein
VKNPLIVPKDIDMSKRYSVEEIINRINDDNATTYVPKDFGLKPNTEVPAFDVVSSPRFIKELKKGGFDGIKAYEGGYSTWNVFDNKQITRDLAKVEAPSVSTLPSSTTAKEDLAKMPGVLPKAERDANLNKMLEGSKAVDKDGNPIRLYHGTNQDINEFSTQPGALRKKFYAGELGSWFGDDPEIANQFAKGVSFKKEKGSVYPVFLNIKNPKVFDSYDDFMSVMQNRKSAPAVRKELIKQGYDGIQVKDSTTDFGGKRDDWVAFFPEQVKSAIGNRGTYDPTNPDITKAKGGEVRKPK